VAPHGIYLSGEGGGREDRRSAPGRHREQISIIRDNQKGSDFSNKIQDQVVLVIGAVVHCAGHICQQPSPAVLSCLRDDRDIGVNLCALPLEQALQYPSDVVEDVG
jgi:hypothetical protein